ncbi:bifunctional 4-hydroxy-2-oxoglutarate aldolase/2-dehydro-3-deoxy-phosphogluconate aldolase [Paenibacillus phytohabitans]|nr:bifunctional 4-hydroxy-2-oxoglutarate aldolase/2-dehydro-3-deoxy-phosphogluconate aldolase [Paenibacillus phytohabitans]
MTNAGRNAEAGAGASANVDASKSVNVGASKSWNANNKSDNNEDAKASISVMEKILEYRVVAILRGIGKEDVLPVAEALVRGGIRLLEIPFNQRGAAPGEDAPAVIRLLKHRFGGSLCIGAGTALTAEQVDLAADAGAEFILSPGTSAAVIARTKERGLVAVPGAATASEMAEAYRCGADIVKLFPAGDLGLGYMKSVLAPLNHIPVMAVGGVDEHNLQDWLAAGASTVGVGARLVQDEWVRNGRYDELSALAAQYVSRVAEGGKTGR